MTKDLTDIIQAFIKSNRETWFYDFKSDSHPHNPTKPYLDCDSILKDIICLANVPTPQADKIKYGTQNRYLIIGYDGGLKQYTGLQAKTEENLASHKLVNYLKDRKFLEGIIPTVYSDVITIQNQKLLIITIEDQPYKPYILQYDKELQCGNKKQQVYAGKIYSRNQDSNTVICPDLSQIENMFKERLGIDLPPLKKLSLYMSNAEDWLLLPQEIKGKSYYYYQYDPLWKVELSGIRQDHNAITLSEFIREYWYLYDDYGSEKILDVIACNQDQLRCYYHNEYIFCLNYLNIKGNRHPWYIWGLADYHYSPIECYSPECPTTYPRVYWTYLLKDSLHYNLLFFLIKKLYGVSGLLNKVNLDEVFRIPVFRDQLEEIDFKSYIDNKCRSMTDEDRYKQFASPLNDDNSIGKFLKEKYEGIPIVKSYVRLYDYSTDNRPCMEYYNELVRKVNLSRWVFSQWQNYRTV